MYSFGLFVPLAFFTISSLASPDHSSSEVASQATQTSTASNSSPSDLQAIEKLLGELPKCSIDCVAQGAKDHGCSLTDLGCQCNKMADIINTTAPCFVKAGCQLKDITDAAQVVMDACEEKTGRNMTGEDDHSAPGQFNTAADGGSMSTVSMMPVIIALGALLLLI